MSYIGDVKILVFLNIWLIVDWFLSYEEKWLIFWIIIKEFWNLLIFCIIDVGFV